MDQQINFSGKHGLSARYQTHPLIDHHDYNILRSLANWTNGKHVSVDFLYVLLKTSSSGVYVSADKVIGTRVACFDFIIPKTSLYSALRTLKLEEVSTVATMSWSSGRRPEFAYNPDSTSFDMWHKVLYSLD